MTVIEPSYNNKFLARGGEMGALIRAKDWSKTALGPVENWPQSLRTSINIILNSKFPMFLWWGPQLICLYNDAYRPSLGIDGKHPDILGMPAKEAWAEIWDTIYPLIQGVLDTGEPSWSEDQLIPIYRNGRLEDVYWTFSYSLVSDEDGTGMGVLVTCSETTDKVVNQKKLQEKKEELEFAIESGELGTWDINPITNQFSCSMRVKKWFGLPDTFLHEGKVAYQAIVDSDKERIKHAVKLAVSGVSGGNFEQEFSVNQPGNPSPVIVKAKGRVFFNESGNPLKFSGTLSNVTREVLDKRKIEESERRLRQMILNAPISIAILRGENYVVDIVNEKALALWRRGESEVMGKPILESMPELLDQGIKELVDSVYHTGVRFEATELPVQIMAKGVAKTTYVNFSYEPIYNTNNEVDGIMTIGIDVTDQVLARKRVEQSESQIRTIVESAPFPMGVYVGSDMRIQLANQSILDAWGKGDNVIGKKYTDILPELENQKVFDQIREVYQTAKPFSAKNQRIDLLINGKNEAFYFNYNFTPLLNSEGEVYGVMNTAADVTDLNVAKQKVEESEKRFRNTVRKAPVGIAILHGENFVVDVANETYLQLVSRSEKDFIGKPHFETLSEIKAEMEPLLKKVYTTGETYHGREFPVTINRFGESEIAYFDFVCEALKESSGDISGIIVVATNVTESVVTKHTLAESERQFRNLVMQSPIPMAIFRGKDMVIEMANRVMYESVWRKPEAEVQGNKLLEVFPELEGQKYPQLLHDVMSSGIMHAEKESMAYIEGHDGLRKFYFDFEYAPLFDTDGSVSGIFITVNDVTEKVEARLSLEVAENRLRLATEATELATWDLDLASNSIIYTPRLAKIFGHEESNDIPYAVFRKQVIAEDLKHVVEPAFKEAIKTGVYKYEARFNRPDNSSGWIRTQGRVIYNDAGKPVKLIGTIRDITDEKLRQQELQESEAKFRLLADSMPQYIWTAEPDGHVNYFNKSLYDYTGMDQDKIDEVGWLEFIHPDDRAGNVTKWTESVLTGNDYIYENRFRSRDGEYRWQLSRAIAQKDADGNIQMWVGTSTDIQDQKLFTDKLEKLVLERTGELEQKNKELEKMNAELQSFAYVSSHDLQEPLRKIQTFANRLLERETENLSAAGKDYFVRMQKAAKRMQTLIEDLLAYSRTSTSERKFEYMSLNELVDQVTNELKEDIVTRNAIIETGNLGKLNVIPFQFRQLINNLLGNALKFSRPGVAPHIRITQRPVEAEEVILEKLTPGIDYICLSISDNGIGFEEQYQERIFEVFQRLHGKDEFKGTGIGLAIVKKIVDNHGGFIKASGELNKGARFDIYLPATAQ